MSKLYWIYYREDLTRLNALNPAVIKTTLSGPGTYAFEQNNTGTPLPVGVTPVETFFSYASLKKAIQNGTIIPGVTTMLDDPENWPATPIAEQQDPLPYMQKFAQAAQANGDKTILVPGRDLMQVAGAVCGKRPGDTMSQAYLNCGMPAAAEYAPIYVIQSAAVETDLTDLVSLVRQAAAQARKANPQVIVIATLAAAPNGSPVGYTAINQAARAILPYVQGFELNSTASTDARMISFLKAMASGQ